MVTVAVVFADRGGTPWSTADTRTWRRTKQNYWSKFKTYLWIAGL